jgi:hypothetical protein
MKAKLLLASFVAVAMATPACAASFYVVQDSQTQRCSVVLKKPPATDKILSVVGDGAVYSTKQEATTAMASIEACKSKT